MNIAIPPDLLFFWNEVELAKYKKLEKWKTKLVLAGCPRTDFLTPQFLQLFGTSKELHDELGLDPTLFTITYATGTADAHFTKERIRQKLKIRRRAIKGGVDYLKILRRAEKGKPS